MRYLRLLGLFFRLGTMNEMEYRANFFLKMFQSFIALATALIGVWIVYSYTEQLGGWHADELLVLIGLYFLVGGLINSVVRPSMKLLMEQIWDGELDFTLTKPENLQFLISTRQVAIWQIVDTFVGVVVMAVGLIRLSARVELWQALGFVFVLISGVVILYNFWLILSTLAFWTVRLENIILIFQSMYDAGRWPVGLYPQWLRFGMTFIVPVAFAVTFPAEVLIGRLSPLVVLGTVVLAVVHFFIASWFWSYGVKHYTGASA
jgi:ABC-2 type transport system permease protein